MSTTPTSITDLSVQAVLTRLNNELPVIMAMMNDVKSSPDEIGVANQLEKKLAQTNQDISSIEALIQDNVTYGNRVYSDITIDNSSSNIDEELVAANQRFQTVTHLANQTRAAYLRQRKIMWLWVSFALLLAGGFVYMYLWVCGLGKVGVGGEKTNAKTEHSIMNLPDKRELFDTSAYSFSGNPIDAPQAPIDSKSPSDTNHEYSSDGTSNESFTMTPEESNKATTITEHNDTDDADDDMFGKDSE